MVDAFKSLARTLDGLSDSEAERAEIDAGGLGMFGRIFGGQRLVHRALGTDGRRLGGSGRVHVLHACWLDATDDFPRRCNGLIRFFKD